MADTRQPFSGRTALITGAAGDIGRTAAVRLAAEGARVILADMSEARDSVAQECSEINPAVSPVAIGFDVSDVDETRRALGGLADQGIVADLLFNNAGLQGSLANVADYDPADFRRVLDVNVVGVFNVLQCFATTLIAADQPGVVVNTASMAHGGAPNMAAYSASKAAVIAFTKTAAKDLAPRSIRVNSVSPAFIGPGVMWERQVALQAETPSQYFADDPATVAAQMLGSVPMRRYGSLDEVASVVLFLLSEQSSYITGFDIEVSGGAA